MTEKKEELLVIDPLGEIGHLRFVNRTNEILSQDYDIIFISSSSFCSKVLNVNTFIKLNDSLFKHNGKYTFVIKQIMILLYIYINVIPKYKNTKVLFVGCENISFSLIWRNSLKSYLLLHNNIDKKGMSGYFFKRISLKVGLLVFERYMVNHLKEFMRNEIFVVPHPIFKLSEHSAIDNGYADVEYILLLNVKEYSEDLDRILTYAKKNLIHVYIKSNIQLANTSTHYVHIEPFFKDYYSLMFHSKAVFIHAPYDYRVSGVFIEGMSMGKQIGFIDSSGLYNKKMQTSYPSNIMKSIDVINENYTDRVNLNFADQHSDKNVLLSYQKVFSD